MSGPLAGLKVVDFSRVLAGPLCARTLMDLGAEVIKIEPPRPDNTRFAAPFNGNGMSGYFAQQNAGKRCISIDLNLPEAQEIALKLCDEADILVQNFRPGTLDAYGLDYETLARRNPGLVYVSISGYGQGGPWRSRMAYAPTVQAETGFAHHTLRHFGEKLTSPKTDPLSHGDVYTGLQGVIGVLAALHERSRTGKGQHIDVAMAATMLAINEHAHIDLNGLENQLNDEPAILGANEGDFFMGPEGRPFVSAISLIGSLTFRFFMAAMRRPDMLSDPRFSSATARRANMAELKKIVQTWIYSFSDMASLDAQLDEAKVAIGEIRTMPEIVESEWGQYWGASSTVSDRNGGEFRLPGRPWKFSNGDLPQPGQPALQGEHNLEVCESLGISEEQVQALEGTGALVGNFAETMIQMLAGEMMADAQEAASRAAAMGSDQAASQPVQSRDHENASDMQVENTAEENAAD